MLTRTPQWSKDEQAMIDMIEIGGASVDFFHYYDQSCEAKIYLKNGKKISTRKDTEWEALRTIFKIWRANAQAI